MDLRGLEYRWRHHIQHIAHIFEQNCQQKIEKQKDWEYSSCSCNFSSKFLLILHPVKSTLFTVPIPFSPNSPPPLLQFPPFHPSVNTYFSLQFRFSLLIEASYSLIPPLSLLVSKAFISQFPFPSPHLPAVTVIWASLRFGHLHYQNLSDMSIPCNPTLTHITKVIWEGDAHITGVLRMGMPKTRGCSYHCNTASLHLLLFLVYTFLFPSSLSSLSYFLSFYSHSYHPKSPCLFLRHWHGCYCHRFLKFPVFSGKKKLKFPDQLNKKFHKSVLIMASRLPSKPSSSPIYFCFQQVKSHELIT